LKNYLKTSTIFNLAGLALAWLAIFAFFWWKAPPNFHSLDNFQTMARQATIVAIATLGMTCIIISGGIDLSVGSVVAFVTVIIALLLQLHLNPWIALLVGVIAGATWGFVNGFLITSLKVVPFIVTLGTYLLVRGAAKGFANNRTIDSPTSWLNDLTSQPEGNHAWYEFWKLFPTAVWVTVVGAILVSLMLKRTRFGRHVVAVGSNEQAARLCGVPVERVKLAVYVLAGVFAGLAGLMQYSRLTLGDPTAADGLELKVIAAVVIGGASLNGGQGSILGSLLGAWIMTTISTGCAQMGLDNWVEQMITGAIIVIAVAVDRLRANGAEITLPLESGSRLGWSFAFALIPVFTRVPLTFVSSTAFATTALVALLFFLGFAAVGWVALGPADGSTKGFIRGLVFTIIGGLVVSCVIAMAAAHGLSAFVSSLPGLAIAYIIRAIVAWCATYCALLLVQRVTQKVGQRTA